MCPRRVSQKNPTLVRGISKSTEVLEIHVSKKLDPYKRKPTTARGIRQNVPETYELVKPNPCKRKLTMARGIRQNVLEMYKSRKLDIRKKKFVIVGVCLRRVS